MAILQRPYAGQVKNLTPPAAGCGGWFLAVGGVICCGRWAAGLAGCGVGRCWRWAAGCCEVWQGCGQQGGGVIRAAAGSGWKEQPGQVIGRAVRCSSGRPSPPRPGRSGRSSPWAARSFPVLIGSAAVLSGADRGGQLAEEKPGRTAQAVHSGFFVSAD